MADLLLDVNGDLSISNGDLQITPDIQNLVKQSLIITLKTFRGEWKYNINYGVPYVSNENNPIQILGKVKKNIFDLHIKEAIVSVPGIISLDSYTSDIDFPRQRITVNFKATTSFGSIEDSLQLEI